MMILSDDGRPQPLWRARNWAMERLIYVHVSGDLRWAVLALALESLRTGWALGRRQLVPRIRSGGSAGPRAC